MKIEDYNLIETALQNAYDTLNENMYQICDTSYHSLKGENEQDCSEWNQRLDFVMNEIQCLRAELIFTFRIED